MTSSTACYVNNQNVELAVNILSVFQFFIHVIYGRVLTSNVNMLL